MEGDGKVSKRLLSLVILISLITCTVVNDNSAFAASPTSDIYFDEAYDLLQSLGISADIEKEKTDTVTRAEFVALALRMIHIFTYNKYNNEFKDVTADTKYANEIATAKKFEIISGVNASQFCPEGSIKYGESLKIIISALAMCDVADILGGYPEGYFALADKLGITKRIYSGAQSEISFRDAVVLIGNMLLSDYIYIDTVKITGEDTNTYYYEKSDESVLKHFWNLYIDSGIVWTQNKASMHIGGGSEGTLELDGRKYVLKDIQGVDYIGLNVRVIYDDDNTVISVLKNPKNRVYTFGHEEVESLTADRVNLANENGSTRSYGFDTDATFLYNWNVCRNINMDWTDGILELIDNDDDGRIDVIHFKAPEIYFVGGVSDNVIYDKKSGRSLKLENDDIIFINGTAAQCDELSQNAVVCAYKDEEGDLIFTDAVFNVIHGGMIDMLSADKVTVDGREYSVNSYFNKYYNNAQVSPGIYITAYFDSNNRLTAIEKSGAKSEGMQYGYLLAAAFNGYKGVIIRVLSADGGKNVYNLAEKIILDGSSVNADSDRVRAVLRNGDYTNYSLIKYSLDSDGKVKIIDTPEYRNRDDEFGIKYGPGSMSVNDSLTCFVSKGNSMYRASTNSLLPYAILNGSVIFDVPKELPANPDRYYDASMFEVRTRLFANDERVTADFYDYSTEFAPAAVVNYTIEGSGDRPMAVDMYSDPIAIVKNVSKAINEDGVATTAIDVIGSKREYSAQHNVEGRYFISPELRQYFEDRGLVPEKGDVIQYHLSGNNEIAGIVRFKFSGDKNRAFGIDYSKTGSALVDQNSIICGKIYNMSSQHFAIKGYDNPSPTSGVDYPADNTVIMPLISATETVCYATFDTKQNKVYKSGIYDIKTIENVGEDEASLVFLVMYYGGPIIMFIYN